MWVQNLINIKGFSNGIWGPQKSSFRVCKIPRNTNTYFMPYKTKLVGYILFCEILFTHLGSRWAQKHQRKLCACSTTFICLHVLCMHKYLMRTNLKLCQSAMHEARMLHFTLFVYIGNFLCFDRNYRFHRLY